jgi:hypothetical protein
MRTRLEVSLGNQTAKKQDTALNHDDFCVIREKIDAAEGSVGEMRFAVGEENPACAGKRPLAEDMKLFPNSRFIALLGHCHSGHDQAPCLKSRESIGHT